MELCLAYAIEADVFPPLPRPRLRRCPPLPLFCNCALVCRLESLLHWAADATVLSNFTPKSWSGSLDLALPLPVFRPRPLECAGLPALFMLELAVPLSQESCTQWFKPARVNPLQVLLTYIYNHSTLRIYGQVNVPLPGADSNITSTVSAGEKPGGGYLDTVATVRASRPYILFLATVLTAVPQGKWL